MIHGSVHRDRTCAEYYPSLVDGPVTGMCPTSMFRSPEDGRALRSPATFSEGLVSLVSCSEFKRGAKGVSTAGACIMFGQVDALAS